MKIQNFFSTPIYFKDLIAGSRKASADRLRRDLLKQCYLVRDTDPEGLEWSQEHYPNGYTSYGSITDLHRRYPHFEELSREIDRHVKIFARHLEMDLQEGCLEMTSLWVNIMPTTVTHTSHLHPLSVLSGTYYVSVPQGASALKFEAPRLAMMMAAPPKLPGAAVRNQPFITLQPRPGQVALWESWLRHEVPPNKSQKDRVSISFNYDWR